MHIVSVAQTVLFWSAMIPAPGFLNPSGSELQLNIFSSFHLPLNFFCKCCKKLK